MKSNLFHLPWRCSKPSSRLWIILSFCLLVMGIGATSANAQEKTPPKESDKAQEKLTPTKPTTGTSDKEKTSDKTELIHLELKADSKSKTAPKAKAPPPKAKAPPPKHKTSTKKKPKPKSSKTVKTVKTHKPSTKSPSKTGDSDAPSKPKSSKPSAKNDVATEYASMVCETWESPKGKSELGLEFEDGFVQPYPYTNLMRLFDGNRCRHKGVDIGHVGVENGGMGSVINAVTRSQITLIGRTGEDVGNFGRLDTRSGTATRTGITFPRKILVPGYGAVYPFSRNYGKWRSGMTIVTKVLDGEHAGLTIRYMHMADIRHDLKVGDIVQAGEHIALMGSTAIMDSHPHVHIDFATLDGTRLDPGPYIGLPPTAQNCSASYSETKTTAQGSKKSSTKTKDSKTNAKPKSHSSKSKHDKTTLKTRTRDSYVGTVNSDTENLELRTLEREAEDAERL